MDNPKDMQERAAGAAFTPGPWQAHAALGHMYIHGPDGAELAEVAPWGPAANTVLMAAAPDLYSVLSALLDDMEDRYDGAPDSGMGWMGWHIHQGREALAKAGSK